MTEEQTQATDQSENPSDNPSEILTDSGDQYPADENRPSEDISSADQAPNVGEGARSGGIADPDSVDEDQWDAYTRHQDSEQAAQ